jgi:hypothetical protein
MIYRALIAAALGWVAPAVAQDLNPPGCPSGYTCTPNDARASAREEARRNCESQRRETEEYFTGLAALNFPGEPMAVENALRTARSIVRCD